jgi:hypothetical protein
MGRNFRTEMRGPDQGGRLAIPSTERPAPEALNFLTPFWSPDAIPLIELVSLVRFDGTTSFESVRCHIEE